MRRLIDKRFTKSGFVAISSEERKNLYIPTVKEVYEKLAEYEDLEEQACLIKLPCKVGDTVYIIDRGKILEETVLAFNTFNTKLGETVTTMTATYGDYFTKPSINDLCVLNSGNRLSFFFTREEAEAAVAKMKGE